MYGIAFDEVNFEGNIAFPAAPEVKKPAGYSNEPMNVDSYQPNPLPKPEMPKKVQQVVAAMADPLQESTMIQKPGDTPISLDMNAFLGETQVTRKDIELINDVVFPYP